MVADNKRSKDELLDEIGRLYHKLGRTPNEMDVILNGKIAIEAFEVTFGSWSTAISEFESDKPSVKKPDHDEPFGLNSVDEYNYLYLVRSSEHYVKIGISQNPKDRLKNLQNSCPYELELVAAMLIEDARVHEQKLHERCSEYRQHGEWFDLPSEEINNIVDYLFRL